MHSSSNSLSEVRLGRAASSTIRAYCRSGQLFRERYKICRVLGRGGFGVTYLAQDMLLPGSPFCVVKQLCPKTQNPIALDRAKVRFRREARILANLGSHSQIPQLLDYFTMNGEFYLVQEFVQGKTLAQEIRQQGRQGEAQVKGFLQEILPVLSFIHRHRIIHRDIKPPNIIRCEDDGRLVLIDFGAVREFLTDMESGPCQVPATQFVGTPGFAPPEQLALRPCFSSDIYALGMTCLYLLTSRTPNEFTSDSHTGEVQWERAVSLSPHFTKVLRRMLRLVPQERYSSIDELSRALALEPYLDSLSGCMNTHRRPDGAIEQEDGAVNDNYMTPTQREAAAIRRWRMRRISRKQGARRTGLSTGAASIL